MNKYLLLEIIVLIFLLLLYSYDDKIYSPTIVALSVFVCLLQAVLIIRADNTYYVRPVIVFLFAFFVVNCQLYIDLILGNLSTRYSGFIDQNTINKGALLSAISFTSFAIGYYLVKNKEVRSETEITPSIKTFRLIKFLQIFFFFLWLSQLSISDFTGDSYINSGAHDVTKTNYTDVIFNMTQILTYSYLFKLIKSPITLKDIFKVIPSIFFVLPGLYILIKFMSGDRGAGIFTCFILMFFITAITKYKIKLKILIPVIIFGALIMTSISATRMMGGALSFKEKITYVFTNPDLLEEKHSFLSPTRELANSNICTHIALDKIINDNASFHYGEFHFCYILNCIPFVSSKIIKALDISRENRASSEYITITHSGKYYTSGLGTSTLADNYLELGIVGVVLGLIFIGVLFKIVDNVIINSIGGYVPMYMIIFSFTMCYGALSIPRAYFFYYIRLFLYVFVLYKIIRKIYNSGI